MAVNHFRIGEALFFAKIYSQVKHLKDAYDDVFKLYSEIIEITEKQILLVN
jgi:predicted amino acid racemase